MRRFTTSATCPILYHPSVVCPTWCSQYKESKILSVSLQAMEIIIVYIALIYTR